jgi:hypothetical protein
MYRLNSLLSFAHLLLLQSSLVIKLGVSPSRSRLLTRSLSLSSSDSTTGPRPQCWDVSLTPSQLTIYKGSPHRLTSSQKLWLSALWSAQNGIHKSSWTCLLLTHQRASDAMRRYFDRNSCAVLLFMSIRTFFVISTQIFRSYMLQSSRGTGGGGGRKLSKFKLSQSREEQRNQRGQHGRERDRYSYVTMCRFRSFVKIYPIFSNTPRNFFFGKKKSRPKFGCAAYSRTNIVGIAVFRYMTMCLLP